MREEGLASFLDMPGVLIVALDSKGRVDYVNTHGCAMLGYKQKEMLGKDWFGTFVASGDIKHIRKIFKEVILGKRALPENYENSVRRSDGTEAVFSWHNAPIRDKEGNITGTLSTGNDITQMKSAEEKIRQNEKKYREIFNGVSDMIVTLEVDGSGNPGRILDVNEVIIKKLGYTAEELLKMKPEEIDNNKMRGMNLPKLASDMKSGRVIVLESALKAKNGKIIPVEIHPRLLKMEKKMVAVVTLRDLSERVETQARQSDAEKQLRASEERLKLLFEFAPDAYYLIDTKGVFIDGNLAAEKMIGYSRAELTGKSFFKINLISPDQFPRAIFDIAKNLAGKIAGPTRYTLTQRNGAKVIMEARTYPVKMGGKTVLLGIARDITYRQEEDAERDITAAMADIFSSDMALDDVFTQLPKTLSEKLGFPMAAVVINEEKSGNAVYVGTIGMGDDNGVFSVPLGESIAGTIMSTGKAVFVKDARRRKEYSGGPLKALNILTVMGVPVKAGGKTIGALMLADSVKLHEEGRTLILLQNIANNLSQNIEKMRAIAELRKSEEKYRNVANFTHDWEYWIDEDGSFVYCSPACERITGYKAEEFMNDPELKHKIVTGEYIEKLREHELGVVNDISGTVDYKIVKKNGIEAWISHSCIKVFDSIGNPMGRRCSDREITDRVIMERFLEESEKKYRGLFDNANDAIFLHYAGDLEKPGHFLEVNDAACERLGYTKEELLNMRPMEIDGEEHAEKIPMIMAELFKTGHVTFEGVHVAKNGRRIPVEISAHGFDMAGDRVVMSIARDITDRKNAGEKLKESEEQYRSLFENMKDGFAYHRIIVDSSGTPVDYEFIEVNKAFENIIGIKREKIIGRRVTQVIPEIEKDTFDWIGTYAAVAITGHAKKFESYNESTKKWFSVSAYSNKKGHFAVVFEDITQRKAVSEKINLLSQAMAQSANVVIITDMQGAITYVNPRFTEVTGYTTDEILGKNPRVLKSGYTTPEEYKRMWETIASGQVWRGRFHNKNKNGKLFWEAATISPVRNEEGQVAGFIAIKEDITAIKEAEEQVSESQAMLLDFLENANDMIQIVRPDFSFEYVNRKWRDVLGYSSEQIFKMTLFDLVVAEEKRNFTEAYARMVAGGEGYFVDTVFQAADGTRVIVEGNINCFVESANNIHTRAILRDVTEKRLAETQLLENYEKLKEVDIMKSNFTAMVSHELRTPLTAIKGFTAFLLGSAAGEMNTRQRDYVQIIKSNSDRLLNLINEILDISKMESGTFSIQKKKEEVIHIVDKALNDIASVAERKKLRLVKLYKDEVIEAEIDEYRISQVVLNLLNNAIKFTPENAAIYTGVGVYSSTEIKVPEYVECVREHPGKCLHIWVRDEGAGIDPENVGKVFDRFFQVSDQDQRIFKGVGLGLNISKNIVEAHGGVIWAESEGRGKGSTFHVLLPM